jgi:hypothetical protein
MPLAQLNSDVLAIKYIAKSHPLRSTYRFVERTELREGIAAIPAPTSTTSPHVAASIFSPSSETPPIEDATGTKAPSAYSVAQVTACVTKR